jgi:hypothetical protein
MSERTWDFVVSDAHARRRRGIVTWRDALPAPLAAPPPPAEFAIVLLSRAGGVPLPVPIETAVCVPAVTKIHVMGAREGNALPARIENLTLPPQRMSEFAAGRIVMAAEGVITPEPVFPADADRPRLDLLALALIDVVSAEAMAPYRALIRHQFHLRPGADPLVALEARLSPADAQSRPPARAPGILRLARALRRMKQDLPPDGYDLDEMAEDLHFLSMFDDDAKVFSRRALDRLLGDVLDAPPPRRTQITDAAPPSPAGDEAPPDNVVPMRRKPAPKEDA